MSQSIVQIGHPVLREKAKALSRETILSKETQELISVMQETMRKAPGVGLAAPQIGVPLQIAVIEDTEDRMAGMLPEIRKERQRSNIDFHVIINPKITFYSEEKALFFEGCLSITSELRITPRSLNVIVECLDEHAHPKIIHANGWYARILQHEIDHLNGKLFIDHADARTKIDLTEANRKKWLNATAETINDYYHHCKFCL